MTAKKIAVQFNEVSRAYRRADGTPVKALDNVSLEVAEGEFICLAGPSGCGKSTLLQICSGLSVPSGGSVRLFGKTVTGPGPDRGFVFQRDSVFPWMTVVKNVEFGLKCRGVPPAERRDIARHYIARVGLSDVENSWPRELSGGMLKRVAIAAVFANGSSVLLLDEPFGALDYVTRHKLHDVLLTLWDEDAEGRRRTVLFVTHDVDEALTLADRVVILRAGRIAETIAIEMARPRTTDSLLDPDMLHAKKSLLFHLGLSDIIGRDDARQGATAGAR